VSGDTNLQLSLISAVGMIVVAVAAVIYWRRVSGLGWKWLWAGAGLWAAAVAFKIAVALLTNAAVIGFLKDQLPQPLFVVVGALYIGFQSSLCEIGFTWLAVLKWRQLGQNADRAIGVGVGAGAIEALLLGVASLVAISTALAHLEGTDAMRTEIDKLADVTPIFWLVAPAERIIAILCHVSTRALVLLGAVYHRPSIIFWGFLLFTLLDGMAGAAHVSGVMGKISVWWIELAILPFALVSIPILKWCRRRWPNEEAASHGVDNLYNQLDV